MYSPALSFNELYRNFKEEIQKGKSNDSLDVLLLDEIVLHYKKGQDYLINTFVCKLDLWILILLNYSNFLSIFLICNYPLSALNQ